MDRIFARFTYMDLDGGEPVRREVMLRPDSVISFERAAFSLNTRKGMTRFEGTRIRYTWGHLGDFLTAMVHEDVDEVAKLLGAAIHGR